MIDRGYFKKLKTAYTRYDAERREVIKDSGDALSFSKQAIFAFHRNDLGGGEKLLVQVRGIAKRLAARFRRTPGLEWEGAYRAMLEEFVEASLYAAYLAGKRFGPVAAPGMDSDAYLGGLLDVTGELVRRAVLEATAKRVAEVRRCHAAVNEILHEVIQLNITGPIRPKYDQAKQNLRKLEEMLYDLRERAA